jgi:hypothetical protein
VATGPGPVPRLGRRGPAAADARRPGAAVLRSVRDGVPHRRSARARAGGPGPQGLAGGRILRTGAPPPRSRATRRAGAPRTVPGHRRGAGEPARGRPVYRPRRRVNRVRASRGGARGERPSRRRSMDARGGRRARPPRPRSPRRSPPDDPPPEGAGRVQRGGHGARRDGLPAEPSRLPEVPGRALLSRPSRARRSGNPPGATRSRPAAPLPGGGRGPRGPGTLARPTTVGLGSPPGPMGVPGRQGRARRNGGGGGPPRAPRGDGAGSWPVDRPRNRPARLQPLHRGAVRVRGRLSAERPREDRARPAVGDAARSRPPAPPQGDREGRGAARGAVG